MMVFLKLQPTRKYHHTIKRKEEEDKKQRIKPTLNIWESLGTWDRQGSLSSNSCVTV